MTMEMERELVLARLKPLRRLAGPQPDIAAYYRSLLRHEDELVRIGAICWLTDNNQYVQRARAAAAALGPVPCLAERLPDVFAGKSARMIGLDGTSRIPETDAKAAKSVAAAVAESVEGFQRSSDPAMLLNASLQADAAAGWMAGLNWSLRAMLVYSVEPLAAIRTFEILVHANQKETIAALIELLSEIRLFSDLCAIESAALLLETSDFTAALAKLDSLQIRNLGLPSLRSRFHTLRGACQAGLGNFKGAVISYELQNTGGQPPSPRLLARMPDQVRTLNSLKLSLRTPDSRADHFMMLGFPRSGTTLLESALSAHPAVETFEEVRAFSQMAHNMMDRAQSQKPIGSDEALAFREDYYRELDQLSADPDATVYIDKTPIRSVYGPLLRRLFPDKRYIFSIRHPYDVVLSCFRTPFGANMSMIHFNRFADACAIYDMAMTNWFDAFPETDTVPGPRRGNDSALGDSGPVCTVRYERLVNEFETELQAVLDFLGVPWDDSVTRFAESAKRRRAKTPSYSKVRKGLSIGVQSAWRDYKFLFEIPEAEPLHHWATRFGYDTLQAAPKIDAAG